MKLKKLADTWQNVVEEDELKPDRPFMREPDQIVSDLDPYYVILFLESELGKNMVDKIKRPTGDYYTDGYIRNVKNGNKGITVDFLAGIKRLFPNFEQDFQKFLDFTLGRTRIDKDEYNKIKSLQDNPGTASTNYCKFLVQATGLNVSQIQDAMSGVDPNTTFVDENGRTKIHKDLVRIVNNTFGIAGADFTKWKEDKNIEITNDKITKLKEHYNLENIVSSKTKSRLRRG